MLDVMKRKPSDEGYFRLSRPAVKVPRCRGVSFLRVADWPRVHVWNGYLGVVEVIDLEGGKILSRLGLDDDDVLQRIDPEELEKPDILNELQLRLSPVRGSVMPAGGRYAYYVPKQFTRQEPGFLKKIDLAAEPPKVVLKGEKPAPDLRPDVAAASEAGKALFVVEQKVDGVAEVASRRVKVFSTVDLTLQSEMDLPLTDCDQLEASHDGKYMYALDQKGGKVAVLDIARGRVVKVLDRVGKVPATVFALPEGKAGQ
jgi:hypothetical protein